VQHPERGCLARSLHVGRRQPSTTPRQPRVAELVVEDAQRVVAPVGIDVVAPHRAGLVQVLVGIDDGRHVRIVHLT